MVQGWYRAYIAMILNRTNTVTGIKYRNDPGIFSWEIMNEPEYPGQSTGVALAAWFNSTAAYIESLDPNHMVDTGEEGFDENSPSVYTGTYTNTYWERAGTGSSYLLDAQLKDISFMSAHLYPVGYGFSNPIADGDAYIKDHINVAQMYGKPFVLGEYGYDGTNASAADSQQKINAYLAWWNVTQSLNAGGDLVWQFVLDNTKCGESKTNICVNMDPALTQLLHRHALIMNQLPAQNPYASDTTTPTLSITYPSNGLKTGSSNIVVTGTASDSVGVLYVQTNVNGVGWTTASGTTSWQAALNLGSGLSRIQARAFNYNLTSSAIANTVVNVTLPVAPALWLYNGTLNKNWVDESWGGAANYENTNPVYNHTYSASFDPSEQWGALSIWTSTNAITNPASYNGLSFYIDGGSGAAATITMILEGSGSYDTYSFTTTSSWQHVSIPMSTLDPNYESFDRIDWQSSGLAGDSYYVDDVELT
jgi:hypothetical protein